MTQMWITAGTEGWWKAHGWKELRRADAQGVEEVLMEHEEDIDAEQAFNRENNHED